MFCINCGAQLPAGANFCFKCGCDLRNLTQSPGTSHSATHELRVGEYITFGRYPQNDGKIKEPIEWIVLEVKGNEALLISRYGLDFYHWCGGCNYSTWQDSALRKWLNNDFLKTAFSNDELRMIRFSDSRDRVFCLSISEVKQFFRNVNEILCLPTVYATSKSIGRGKGSNGCCAWWLRSPGWVSCEGVPSEYVCRGGGPSELNCSYCVRPALWLIWNL